MPTDEPVDYQIGHSEFLNLKIDLSFKPLIPRVETEYWTDLVIKEIKKKNVENNLHEIKVLDIFAGSGCVGLAVLKHTPEAQVDFAEVESKFLEQIKFNAALNNISLDKYKLIESDVLNNIPFENQYDFILANPPYIPEGRKGELDKSVTDYEPHVALFSGPDGLDLIKKFLAKAKNYLNPNSQIWLEFDSEQQDTLKKLLPEFGYHNFTFYKDQYDRWRFVVVTV